jgi:hypothetical protein
MKIQLRNNTEAIITINDVGTISILPDLEYYEFETKDTFLNESNQLIKHISLESITINNYTNDLLPAEGVVWLTTGGEQLPIGRDGKLKVHETSKTAGLYTYWTGRGDMVGNGHDIGNGECLMIHHKPEDPNEQIVYVDFHNIDNHTELHEGYVIWEGARPGDTASCSVVTSIIPTIPASGTNFNAYGPLIVPANGDGTLQPLHDLTTANPSAGCFVEVDTDETGLRTPGFWDADFNEETHKFENIRPNPTGEGGFNMFHEELVVSRFVNQVHFIGNGFERLQSADSDRMVHGTRIKMESHTSHLEGIVDHEWTYCAVLTLQRDKTV